MSDMTAWRLPPPRRGHTATAELEQRRARAAAAPAGEAPAVERTIGGVRCLLVGEATSRATILYFHGGGYRMGSPLAWLAYARRLASAAQARVVLPFYRLAPEHPFPAALHDAASVYQALAAEGPVVVAGDSAGGGLAASLCIAAHDAGAEPAGLILVSPMLDLEARDGTYETHAASDALFSRTAVLDCAALYLQGASPTDPLVSPLHAEPASLPATLVLVGGAEVLLGEATVFARRLAMADRSVILHVAAGMGHVWPMMAPDAAQSGEAIAAMATFVDARLAPTRGR